MRSSIPATLLTLLTSLAVAEVRETCFHLKAADLAEGAACGDNALLRNCFENIPAPAWASAIQWCFVNAGCTPDESILESRWMLKYCDGQPEELKKRGAELEARATTTTAATTAAATTAANTATSTATTSTATSTKATTTGTTSTSLTCSTSTNVISSSCNSNSASCVTSQVATSTCVEGLICESGGCMVREDYLTLSGAIVTAFLAVFVASMVFGICFMCCREKREVKRKRAMVEAAAIAKAKAIETRRPDTSRSASTGGDPFSDGRAAS